MTLVVCPNLAIDRVLAVPALVPGATMRGRLVSQQTGGKGANVLRALRILGGEGLLAGFAAGAGGRLIAELAAAENLAVELVDTGGEARVSTVVLAGRIAATRFFEYGPGIGRGEEKALLRVVAAHRAAPGEWAIVDGAAPPGAADGFYGALCATLREAGYRVLLDATGAQLAAALPRGPDLVKVNRDEALAALEGRSEEDGEAHGRALDAPASDRSTATPAEEAGAQPLAEELQLCERLVAAGARDAVVTAGRSGAAALFGGHAWRVPAQVVAAVNSTGSGDCFAAALMLGFERGDEVTAALAAAAGAAAANAADPVTGRFDLALAQRLTAAATPVSLARP